MSPNVKDSYIESLFDLLNNRISSHSEEMRSDLRKIFEKIDAFKTEQNKEFKEIYGRLGALETQRASFGEFFTRLIGIIGGASGLYALGDKIFGKHP